MPQTEQFLAHYQITARLGAGGMGEVFRARDTRLNREVAIKILPREFASDPDRLRRFELESKTLAALNHPNVLTIYDANVHEGTPYLVSELLEGKTLREDLGTSTAALPVRRATGYALQIAQGLAAAHGQGIIHRDLKPENIFITKDGRVKILDFGLAKLQENFKSQISDLKSAVNEAPTLVESTEPGKIMGTPAYMSPEQVRGESVDHQTDIFAFGCVLYEMLSGTRAFRRDTPIESMHAVLKEEAPDPGARNPNITPTLARVVLRCLEKEPDNRFQSARDLAFALSEISSSHLPGPGSSLSGRPRMLPEAWKWTVATMALALVLLFGFSQPWKKWGSSPIASASRANSPAADSPGPLSRARQICVKGLDASRDELKLAIALCQSAIDRDRSNAEAWALLARLSCTLYDEYDRTSDLLNAAQSAAQNALSLAPSSVSARLAQANVYALQEATYSQSLDVLRRLERDAPDNPDVLVTLGRRLLFPGASRAVISGTNNAALKLFDRALALRPGDARALNYKAWALSSSGKNAEADAAWNESIRRTGSREALLFRFYDLAYNREQPEEAKALLAQFPPDLVFNDLAVIVVTYFWLDQHEPAKALAFIRPFPRDFLEDHFVELPKGYLVGKAYAQAGDLAAARLEWSKALEVVDRRLVLNPENPRLINCKACLLSLLGESDEAAKQAEIYQQLTKLDDPETVLTGTVSMFMEMGRVQNAISLIQNNPKIFSPKRLRRYAALYPIVGSAPEFQTELAKIEAEDQSAGKSGATNTQTGSAGSPNTNSVAVLPFVNLSPDKADEYLSDGMTEELLNALSRVEGLRVPGRSSSFAFKGRTEEDLFRKVGEQLHVGAVLEGSVRKAGDHLRINADLIKVADGFSLWSQEYDRDMTNIFAIQSDIAARVAEALKVQLLGRSREIKKPTESIEAYKLYLKGRQLWNRRTGETITQAINCFNQAIAADPAYALAYSGLADCYAVLCSYSWAPVREVAPKTRAAALKAVELDDTLGEPHAALGITKANLDWDWPGAEAEFRRAIELNPNYATTHHWFGIVLSSQGKFKEALAEYQRALELDPLSPIINANVAWALFATGKEDLAIQMLRRQISLQSDFEPFHGYLGEFYLLQGKLPEAIHELETAFQTDKQEPDEWGLRGFAYARAGRVMDAQRLLGELDVMRRQGQNVSLEMAWIQYGLGNDSQALDLLEQAAEDRATELPDALNSPLWKALRAHPRAQAILRKMNLIK